MTFVRTGHGNGKGTPHVEVTPADELSAATAVVAVPSDRSRSGRFTVGNTAAKAKRFKVGNRGLAGVDKADPRYLKFARWGRSYAARRRLELAKAHGGTLSAGVGAMIESAALAMAASRFVHCVASESGDADMFKRASALANDARQNELAAWELAARESKVHAGSIEADMRASQVAFQRQLAARAKGNP